MKRIEIFLHWLPLYLIVVVMIGIFLWEEDLSISSTSHTLLGAGILVVFGFFIHSWVDHHEENFIVSHESLKELELNDEQNELSRVHLEDKNG